MPAFLFVLMIAGSAHAQVRWGARAGSADGSAMLGADSSCALGSGFFFNPSVGVSGGAVTTNADVHYDVGLTQQSGFWLGTGIAGVIPEEHDLATEGDQATTIAAGVRF